MAERYRTLARQLDDACRHLHAAADGLEVLTTELERCEQARREAEGRWSRLRFEIERLVDSPDEIALTRADLVRLLRRSGVMLAPQENDAE